MLVNSIYKVIVRKQKYYALVLAVVLLALVYLIYEYQKPSRNGMIFHGNVDIRQVDLGFRVPGRIESLEVEEGDFVKRGQQLAQLEKTPFTHEKDQQLSQLNEAMSRFNKFKTGNRPGEIQEAMALVREREVNYSNAKKILARQAELVKKKLSSQQAFDDAETQATESEAQLKTAQEALKLSKEGFRKEDIESMSHAYEAAKARWSAAVTNLDDTTLFSPNDGTILSRVRETGSVVAAGDIVYVLSLDKPVWVRAYIRETDLGKIKPGQKVHVFNDSFPKSPLEGQIGFISPQAEFTPKNVETEELRTQLVYRIRITVNDPKRQLRQGMPVTIRLPTDAS